ncbi:MAG: FISUMP domain-containing protein, partial [Bacteroidota bacterium]
MNTSIKEVFSRLYSGAQSKLWTLLAVFLFTLHAPLHAQIKNINKTNDTISIPTQEIDSVWFDTNSGEMKVRKQDGTIQGHVFSEVNSFTFSANIYPSNGVYCNNLPTVPVEVTNATTGRVWMDRNLGASRVALSSTDALAYGDLYQWGRRADGHQCRNSPTTADLSSNAQTANGDFILTNFPATDWLAVPDNNLWQGFSGVNNPCPAGFRLPTANELQDERNSWTSNNIAGAFSNNLKWTLSGFRDFDGSLQEVNASAYYWSGNIDLLDAKYLKITSGTAAVLAGIRSLGMAVRCIKDNTYGNNAIYCNALPTQVVEVTTPTGKTWMDRNLGASQVAASANDVNAYGDLYQWGRRADGHQCRNSSTTSALSSSAQPAHGDFIVNNNSPWNWQSNINDNLWQGVEAINNPCPAGYRLPSAAEFEAERLYWSSQDASGAFASPLKLALPGYRSGNAGELSDVGNLAYYWTNTVNLSAAQALTIGIASASTGANLRTYGLSVRCIKQVSYPQGSVACMQVPTLVVDVTNPQTGKTWMDRNLGASRAAQNSSDNLAYGDLYQWGRRADGHQCRYSANSGDISTTAQPVQGDFIVSGNTPFDWLSNANNDLWLGANASNNPCPLGYRLPTEAELDAERVNWISNDAAGAFASPLKWPMAGFRSFSNGALSNVGSGGYYWSRNVFGIFSKNLDFDSNNSYISNSGRRAGGLSVRCIKDEGLPHTCGAGSVHNPTLNYGSMTDQDGNVYNTIVIGTQEWMAENLKASHYRNGDAIPVVADSATWVNTLNGATCFYDNDSAANNCPYGKLYNWYAASDVRNLCPAGWHVPTDAEWTTLTTFLGGENVAGGKMKSTGTQYWLSPNAAADNSSGFSGLPGGSRNDLGSYSLNGHFGFLWSSTETNTFDAFTRT